jgi:hypothetical protein
LIELLFYVFSELRISVTMATVFNGVLDVTYRSDVSLVPIKGQLQLKSTDVMSSNAIHWEMYTIQHCVIKFVSYLWQIVFFFPSTPVSFTNKTDRHDIAEILLKVALNTIILTL